MIHDFLQYTLKELQVMAASANIPYEGLKKAELILELMARGFVPTQGPGDTADGA